MLNMTALLEMQQRETAKCGNVFLHLSSVIVNFACPFTTIGTGVYPLFHFQMDMKNIFSGFHKSYTCIFLTGEFFCMMSVGHRLKTSVGLFCGDLILLEIDAYRSIFLPKN